MKKAPIILLHFAKLCYNLDMKILKCPVCGKPLHREKKSFFCDARHCYDIAKSGYVNLLAPNQKRTPLPGDNAEMIAARTALMDKGYYDSLANCINNILEEKPCKTVLDIGCGEGVISRKIKEHYPETCVLGIDISKFAVDTASKRCKENLYAVASSAALPLLDSTVDVAINTFAPIDQAELKRVLVPGGIFIKIVPAPDHLWQLKELLYEQPYKNPEPSFAPEGMTLLGKQTVNSLFTAKGKMIQDLLQMTPYYYKTPKESIARITSMQEITTLLSFCVLYYSAKPSS